MIHRTITYLSVLIFMMSTSCITESSHQHNSKENTNNKSEKEVLITANKYLVVTEKKEISNYIRRHKLDVTETGSGLKYQITKHGDGEKAEKGKIAILNYKLKLITGDVVYSSDTDGQKVFTIGHGGVESGLEEAILHMRVGDEAIIIIPSHLAFGLLGDTKKIPQRSTVIYEIEFTNIN